MRSRFVGAVVVTLACASLAHGAPSAPGVPTPAIPAAQKAKPEDGEKHIARGRNILRVAGCNDCHTAGYAAAAGKVPEAKWLLGDGIGRSGSWGTTYPANLRLLLGGLSEAEWVEKARALKTRPPMPWYGLREMRKADLVAVYRHVRKLGPSGLASPAFLPPGTEPKTPFVQYPAAKP